MTTPTLGDLQGRSIAHSTARLNIWSGAVRSGKTIASLLRWLMYVASAPRGGVLIVSGKTLDTVARNVFGPLQDPAITGPAAAHVHYTRGASTGTILGRPVEIITANDARAEGRLRGLTSAGAYVDELTLLPEEFFAQLLARLSVPGAKLFATTNPDGPAHWVRKKFLLRQHTLDLRSWHFTLDDNPALDPKYVTDLKNEYTGLWYRRYIKGEWCLAEGAVYPMWDPDRHVVTELPTIVSYLGAGIDHGSTNPFHAVLLGLGIDNRLYITSEYRHDSKLARRDLSDAQYAVAVREWLDSQRVTPEYIVVDPAAKHFRTALHHDGLDTAPGNNDVLNGIRSISSLLSLDLLKVSANCPHLIEEFPGYSWDDKAAERGIDQPIKVADHGLDGTRYVVYTTRSLWRDTVTPAA